MIQAAKQNDNYVGDLTIDNALSIKPHRFFGDFTMTDEMWDATINVGPTRAFFRGDKVIAAMGITPRIKGTGETWFIKDESITMRDMVFLTKAIVALMDHYQLLEGYRRLSTVVVSDFDAGLDWALKLGFEAEGLMRCYDTEGRDYYLFGRIV